MSWVILLLIIILSYPLLFGLSLFIARKISYIFLIKKKTVLSKSFLNIVHKSSDIYYYTFLILFGLISFGSIYLSYYYFNIKNTSLLFLVLNCLVQISLFRILFGQSEKIHILFISKYTLNIISDLCNLHYSYDPQFKVCFYDEGNIDQIESIVFWNKKEERDLLFNSEPLNIYSIKAVSDYEDTFSYEVRRKIILNNL